MSVLRAKVLPDNGDSQSKVSEIAPPQWVEIEKCKEKGYVLVHVYEAKICRYVHTWHSSIASAMAEAHLDFSVAENEWSLMSREDS